MQSVISGGINADSRVAAAELGPGNSGGSNTILTIDVTLIHGDAIAVGGQEDHGVGAAVAAADLNKITGTGRGKQIADGAVAFAGQIRQATDQSGIAAVEIDLVIVRLALGAANVIAEQEHMYLFGEPLALFAAVWSLVDWPAL